MKGLALTVKSSVPCVFVSIAFYLIVSHSVLLRITVNTSANDEERIFAMLLILVLAPLFCPRLAEEELRGVKQKNMLIRVGHTRFSFSTFKD